MGRLQLTELTAFVAVAEHLNFTRAAAQVGISLPTMSQTIRGLEERLGVRLFNRTTRSVALTEAGERLLVDVQPILDGVDAALERVNTFRDKPVGTLRVAVARTAAAILRAQDSPPPIAPFLAAYPGIRMEITVEDAEIDIVAGRFDAGVRIGHRIERDMTALRILEDFRLLAVASPAYLVGRPSLSAPADLRSHDCIRLRAPWDQTILSWLFSRDGRESEVAVDGPLVVNDIDMMLSATLEGVGVGYLPEPMVAPLIDQGALVSLLPDWARTVPGVFLYHPSRRQAPMALQALIAFIAASRPRGRRKPA
jgi:DNA-binding transcriptional LysR family regulator